jgi:hypothetical protein
LKDRPQLYMPYSDTREFDATSTKPQPSPKIVGASTFLWLPTSSPKTSYPQR